MDYEIDSSWDAFKWFFGDEFMGTMKTALIILGAVVGVLLILTITAVIWNSITSKKLMDSLYALSETPDENNAENFAATVEKLGGFGRFLIKGNKKIKTEGRSIFNSSVANSSVDSEKKNKVREALISLGCKGLLAL